MMPRLPILCSCGLLLVAPWLSGCRDGKTAERLAQIQDQNRALQVQNNRLQSELQQAMSDLQASREQFDSLRTRWDEFERAFLPEQRDELKRNVLAAHEAIEDARKRAEGVTQLVDRMKALAEEAERLRQLCQQHAEQSADADFVGQIQASLKDLDGKVSDLDRKIGPRTGGPISTRIQRLESETRSLRSELQSVRSKVRRIP